jgi:hypothetical protein
MSVTAELPNAFDDLNYGHFTGSQARELKNLKARAHVPYDPAEFTPQEAIAKQLGLIGTAAQLPFNLSPATVAALVRQINPDRLAALRGQQ